MIDILPRFSDGHVRLRLAHIEAGKELSLITPQGIVSERKPPKHFRHEFQDSDLYKAGRAPSESYIDLLVRVVQDWLNTDPLLWCQYGAKIKLNKLAHMYTITLYPYPP